MHQIVIWCNFEKNVCFAALPVSAPRAFQAAALVPAVQDPFLYPGKYLTSAACSDPTGAGEGAALESFPEAVQPVPLSQIVTAGAFFYSEEVLNPGAVAAPFFISVQYSGSIFHAAARRIRPAL